jgi:hypothetical protein
LFLSVCFETFPAAEIERLPFDGYPASVAHRNIGMAKRILYQIFTGSGEINLGRARDRFPPTDQLVEQIKENNADDQLYYHLLPSFKQ